MLKIAVKHKLLCSNFLFFYQILSIIEQFCQAYSLLHWFRLCLLLFFASLSLAAPFYFYANNKTLFLIILAFQFYFHSLQFTFCIPAHFCLAQFYVYALFPLLLCLLFRSMSLALACCRHSKGICFPFDWLAFVCRISSALCFCCLCFNTIVLAGRQLVCSH